ncbi:MAG TPA: hypothetical protein VNM89_00810 [Solirubrobacterales bacterium]|nr:hypothetical protein [Solirubrobacterales bacterium]
MSPEQRLRAARRGRLSRAELTLWAAHYPDEVPLVNGEHTQTVRAFRSQRQRRVR